MLNQTMYKYHEMRTHNAPAPEKVNHNLRLQRKDYSPTSSKHY